ncbi:hypothetical protein B7P43_G01400, partial [Cryptotermes secundus]
ANSAATQELPSILWNPKVHHRVHKTPPLVPILSQIFLIHTIPSYLSNIHFNIIHPPTPWSSLWCLSNCAATQELPSILWNPKAHYHVHKSPPLVPVLRQINRVHTTPPHLSYQTNTDLYRLYYTFRLNTF